MAVGAEVVLVGGVALEIHSAGVPVALLWDALRGPVGPDAELRVAEPVGGFVGAEGGPGGLEGTRGNAAGWGFGWVRDGCLGRGLGLGEEMGSEGGGGGGGEGVAEQATASEVARLHGCP